MAVDTVLSLSQQGATAFVVVGRQNSPTTYYLPLPLDISAICLFHSGLFVLEAVVCVKVASAQSAILRLRVKLTLGCAWLMVTVQCHPRKSRN